jgi:cyclopropane fatty-acyl-phospholipid synthase-like methyltransferase
MQFLSPLMTLDEENEYYRNYYEKQRVRHFAHMSKNDIQNRAMAHYLDYNDVYTQLLTNRRSVLEIGCGSGGFLKFTRQAAPDISLHAIDRDLENQNFVESTLADVDFLKNGDHCPDHQFDLVAGFGLFEHLRDGADFLRRTRRLISPSGLLALNIPNKMNPLVYTYNLPEFRKFAYMKQHYYTYTEKSLHILAERCGYVIDHFTYMQVWSLDNHLSWIRHRQPRDFSDMTNQLSLDTMQSYNQDLIRKKTTDIFMVVMKPLSEA